MVAWEDHKEIKFKKTRIIKKKERALTTEYGRYTPVRLAGVIFFASGFFGGILTFSIGRGIMLKIRKMGVKSRAEAE